MRYAILALLIAAAAPAIADNASAASACYSISDADARSACLAKVHKDPGRCYAVQAADKRAICIAEVKGK